MKQRHPTNSHKQEFQRLKRLNQVYNPASLAFIKGLALHSPQKILDVGCGSGELACWFGQHFGPQTTVVGIDINPYAIEQARQRAKQQNLPHVEFKLMSAYDLKADMDCDLAYCRFILGHLTNPKAALKAITSSMKSDASIICETAIYSHCFSDPTSSAYDQFIKYIKQLFTAQGKDYDIGKSTASMLSELGLTMEHQDCFQPLLRSVSEKQMMVQTVRGLVQAMIEEAVLAETEINRLFKELEEECLQPCFWAGPALLQVHGIK